jgi:hypothetical protein
MTWYWDIDNDETLLVWDHSQDPTTDSPYRRLTSDDEEWSWVSEFPPAILGVMHDRAGELRTNAREAAQDRDFQTTLTMLVEWMTIVEDMAGEQIERVES